MWRTDRWPRRVSCPAHALPMQRSRPLAPRSVSRVRPSGHLLRLLRSSGHSVKASSEGSDRARRQSGDASADRRRPAHQRSARRMRTLQHRRSANPVCRRDPRPFLVHLFHGCRHRRPNGAHRLPGLSTRPATCRASRRTACTAPNPKRGPRARAHQSREDTIPGLHANPRRKVGARTSGDGGSGRRPAKQDGRPRGRIEPKRVFDRVVRLDQVPDGYRAMNEQEAIKIMVELTMTSTTPSTLPTGTSTTATAHATSTPWSVRRRAPRRSSSCRAQDVGLQQRHGGDFSGP